MRHISIPFSNSKQLVVDLKAVIAFLYYLIEKLGLKVEIKYGEDKKQKDGIVLEQSVKEKEKVEKGKTITLKVNKLKENDDKKENNIKNETTTNTTTNNNTNNTTTNTTT